MPDTAIDVVTVASCRRKDRAKTQLRQQRYERAVLCAEVGRWAQARPEMERVHGEDRFEDERGRLGLAA